MTIVRIAGAAALAVVAAALLSAFGPRAQFTADGYDYAIVMLMDRGLPYAQAQARAERFYAGQPVAKVPDVARWLHGKPEYWNLFSVRPLYPWIASRLYPLAGFNSLIVVSRASYAIVAALTFLLALRFAPLSLSFLLAIGISLFPPWRDIARDSLTDPLAIALMAGALYAGAWVMARRTIWNVGAFAILCGLLSMARPIPYILLGAGIVAGLAAPRTGDRSRLTSAVWITAIAAIWTTVLEVALSHAHAPSFRWIVQDTYAHFVARGYAPPGESLRAFFVHEELTIGLHMLVKGLITVVPVLAIVGMVIHRRDAAAPLLMGACAATWLGALVDPDRFDIVRCVIMPVAPAVAAFAAGTLATLWNRVPVLLGPQALLLRHYLPRRFALRNTTVKE
ncbi:MAG: hypothetical protein ACREMP_03730 [Candidatus Tyrphobacter sp.]